MYSLWVVSEGMNLRDSLVMSHTQTVREFTVNSKDQQYVFVDTPGFANTFRSDEDILRTIAEWLEKQ